MTFVNPIGPGLRGERVDQGVDYGGSGPLYALGAGTIVNVYNSGWPGGTFIGLHLDSGQYVYYAENIQPTVSVGQKVSAGQQVGHATGGPFGIEIGWAAAPGTGNALAATTGQNKAGLAKGDPGAYPTGYGVSFSNLIQSLGGPPGIVSGPVQGAVPTIAGVPSSGGSLPAGCVPGAGLVVMAYALFNTTKWRWYVPRRKRHNRKAVRQAND